jgi:hypothetical protein
MDIVDELPHHMEADPARSRPPTGWRRLGGSRETGIECPPIVNNLDLDSFRSSPHTNVNLMQCAVRAIRPCVFDHIADKLVEAYPKLRQYVLGEADFVAESL